MEIDFSKLVYSQCESWREEQDLKAGHLIKFLRPLYSKGNQIIIPMTVYNMIESNDNFKSFVSKESVDAKFEVGQFFLWRCFVDLNLNPDTIIINWDRQKKREFKIDSLLNNTDYNSEELVIKLYDW